MEPTPKSDWKGLVQSPMFWIGIVAVVAVIVFYNLGGDETTVGIILGGFVVYFLPSILGRQRPNRGRIFIINLLLGWTVIGWVVALVMAMNRDLPAQ